MPDARLLRLLGGLLAVLCLGSQSLMAASEKEEQTRQQLRQLAVQISQLQQQLERQRQQFGTAQDRLRATDLEIQSSQVELRELEGQQREQQQKLEGLKQNQQKILAELGLEKRQLAEQLRRAWLLGRGSQLKLLLNQDDFRKGSRMLAYYHYFNQSRLTQIEAFDRQLAALEENYALIQDTSASIRLLQIEARGKLQRLEEQRQQRQTALQELEQQIAARSSRLEELKRDRRDLETLLEKLQDLLADIPDDLGQTISLKDLKGRLPLPLEGRIRYRFGDPRGGDLRWKGWFLEAAPGSPVHSIASGRVAYADWLRGYGLLIILDHGDGYMSLYSNNEGLFKAVGEWVKPGEAIAQSGPAMGGSHDGLYFELRHAGKALNPAHWLKK